MVDGRRFRGVVDTGSPFVLLSTCEESPGAGPGGCRAYCRTWGCTTPGAGEPSGLADTDEVYAAGSAHVAWRRGDLGLGGAYLGRVAYGAMLEVESYGGNGGGAFLGLVRERAERIRPTLLGQTAMRSLAVDLRSPGAERLELSAEPLEPPADVTVVPLVDLRPAGAPVRFYAAEVSELSFAGERVPCPSRVVAVLDTGTTGLEVPPVLFERWDTLRRARAGTLGLRAAQAVEVKLAARHGPPVSLSLAQGRFAAYGDSSFDIVTPLPEPAGIDADAAALWAGTGAGVEALEVRGGTLALPRPGRRPGLAQAERPVARGGRFVVRLAQDGSAGMGVECDVAVGLAARGAGSVGSTEGLFALTSGGRPPGARVGQLSPGDVVECGLTEEGSAYWRVNGGEATPPLPVDSVRQLFPTVEAGPGCGVELLEGPMAKGRDTTPRWAEATRPETADRPLVIFLGLGFLLGRSMSIDTVSNLAVFET